MSSHLYSLLFSADLSSCQLFSPYLSSSLRALKSSQPFSGPKATALPTQYYFVLQDSRKVLPSTTLHYKACANTSQYYFVLQSWHKVLPSTTLHYKACREYFPVLLCKTKLAQSISLYYKTCTKYFTRSKLLHGEAFTHRSFYTQQAFTQRSLYTQQAFTHSKLLHRIAPTRGSFYTAKLSHTASFYTQQAFTHSELLYTASFTHSHGSAICRDWLAKRNRTMRKGVRNCSSKTGWVSAPKRKTNDNFEALVKWF